MLVKINLSGHPNNYLKRKGFIYPANLEIDLNDEDLFYKIVGFLRKYIKGGDKVIVALPGLPALAVYIVTAIHGITGTFPSMQMMVGKETGYEPGKTHPLNDYRNKVARRARKNVVKL